MAYVGGSVTINCSYQIKEKSEVKSFCREDKNQKCTNVISTQSSNYTQLHRFSLTDHRGREVYTVVISMLTQDDAGTYQCALRQRSHTVCLTKIHLHVLSWSDIIPTNLTCITGEKAKVECHYSHSFENYTKYLCKGENPSNCEELIRTTEATRTVENGKFNIRDNKRMKYFYVYIMNLDTTDSGTYWCGFDSGSGKWHHGNFTKIHPCVGVIGGVAACLVTVITAVIALILYRHRLTRTQGGSPERSINDGQNTQENHEGREYEEIQLADQLHYATVIFQTATGSADRSAPPGTAENGTAPPLYSTVRYSKEL
ncbi:hypothetical protein INR49_026420 [Caranx melampygus]|nr:hypothetical protein INR49_026420 [Caranx melampygus]